MKFFHLCTAGLDRIQSIRAGVPHISLYLSLLASSSSLSSSLPPFSLSQLHLYFLFLQEQIKDIIIIFPPFALFLQQ